MLSDARESTNRVKNGDIKEFISEIVVVLVRKGSYKKLNIGLVKDTENLEKKRKTWSMTKNGRQKFWP